MLKWVLVATIMFVYALGIEAQGVLTGAYGGGREETVTGTATRAAARRESR